MANPGNTLLWGKRGYQENQGGQYSKREEGGKRKEGEKGRRGKKGKRIEREDGVVGKMKQKNVLAI